MEHQIQENADSMSQDLADQRVLKVPKIMHANLVYLKAFRQMRANRFNELPDAFAKSEKLLW